MAAGGIVIGIVSIVLVSRQSGESLEQGRKKNAGVGIAMASGVLVGLFYISFARASPTAGMWPLLSARVVSVSLFGGIALAGRHSIRVPRAAVGLIVATGAMDMLANALYLIAARNGPLSIVVTLSSLYPASTVLLARLVLREHLNGWQLAGVGCALAAVVLIVAA
jgi:drug/metabolite transporter (DMT)-like permease